MNDKKPSIYAAGLVICAFFVMAVAFSDMIIPLIVSVGIEYSETLEIVIQILYTLLTSIVPIGLYCLICRPNMRETFKVRSLSGNQVLLLVFIGMTVMLGGNGINNAFSYILTLIKPDFSIPPLFGSQSVGYILAMAAMSVVMAPLTEEFMMRGFVLSAFDKKPAAVGIVFTAAAFGVMHLTMYQVVYAFILGIFLALAVHYTRSVWAGVIVHAVSNALSVGLTLIMQGLPSAEGAGDDMSATVLGLVAYVVLGLICLAIGAVLIRRLKRVSAKCNVQKYGEAQAESKENLTANERRAMLGVLGAGVLILLINFLF